MLALGLDLWAQGGERYLGGEGMARRLWKASGLQLRGIFILPEVRLWEYGLDRSIILPLTRTGYVISAPLATRLSLN